MAVEIKLRQGFSAGQVQAAARGSKDVAQFRRLLAIASFLEGSRRSKKVAPRREATDREGLGCSFHEAGPDGLATRKAPGLEPILDASLIPEVCGVVRWRLIDLVQWLWNEFEVLISKRALCH